MILKPWSYLDKLLILLHSTDLSWKTSERFNKLYVFDAAEQQHILSLTRQLTCCLQVCVLHQLIRQQSLIWNLSSLNVSVPEARWEAKQHGGSLPGSSNQQIIKHLPADCPELLHFLLVTWLSPNAHKAILILFRCQLSDILQRSSSNLPWAAAGRLYSNWPPTDWNHRKCLDKT